MSDQDVHPATTAVSSPGDSVKVEQPPSLFPVSRSWKIACIFAVIMVVLALLGVVLSTASKAAAPVYWISLVPIYGLLCMGTAWARSKHGGTIDRGAILRQLFHWLGIGVAIALDFFIRGTGEESSQGAGLNALLLLALGCYLAGIHLEWLFILVGILLSVTLIIFTQAQAYVWLIILVGVLAVAAMLGVTWLLGRERAHKGGAGKAAHPAAAGS
jgi:hypothetical protein